MNEVRDALYKLLSEDPQLKDLAKGGTWFESADGDAPPGSVVLFSQISGPLGWTFAGPPTAFQMWDIKGVGPTKQAGEIDDRCRALLTDSELAIEGRETLYLRPTQDINYREQRDGETYQHVGATYSITTERTE